MKNAVLSQPSDLLELSAPAVQPQPAGWRSEAFAEDLPDVWPAAENVRPPKASPARPLLRRVLAAVVGR